ncbi:response regulator [Natrinema longum]|uniref:Response regulator n=1 Tax=Natrinema longum TaxID=370324 RepID=A0A8A2UC96_9EURY|nr:response regulator [Natrinema longum]MBZ6496286.1 response regulator [Natrinema longum]QSW85795.1 response regulator [Natrinema longum]
MSGRGADSVDVLLVENDDADARLIREAFDELAIETSLHVVADGNEALAQVTDHDGESPSIPDLVLLDMDSPGMSGLEVLEALSDESELVPLPVLVLTRSPTREHIDESYELAANASLRKPSDPAGYTELVDAIADFWFKRAELPTDS